MQFTIQQEALVKALKDVSGAINGKAIQPVLSNVLIESLDMSTVRITGTDLDITISVTISGLMVMAPGAVTIPHRLLLDSCSKLPSEAVTITTKEGQAEVTCRKSKFTYSTMDASDYPAIKRIEPNGSALSAELLRLVVNQTAFAAAEYDQSSILGGVYLSAEGGKLNAVATDGSRLSHREEKADGAFGAIIPVRAVNELARVFGTRDAVSIAADTGSITAKSDTHYLNARIIGGEYPRYPELFPDSYTHSALVNREALLSALTRVAVMSDDRTNLVRIDFGADKLTLKANTPDVGDASEEVTCIFEGAPLTVACNFRYMLDVLKVLGDTEVRLEMTGAIKPVIFKGTSDDHFRYLLMPVQCNF